METRILNGDLRYFFACREQVNYKTICYWILNFQNKKLRFQNLDGDSDLGWRYATATEKLIKVSAGYSNSSSGSTDYSQFAVNL
jgi:hypothetical protein